MSAESVGDAQLYVLVLRPVPFFCQVDHCQIFERSSTTSTLVVLQVFNELIWCEPDLFSISIGHSYEMGIVL